MFAQEYKKASSEASKGNVNADLQTYTFSGVEANATTIRLRKMHDKNTYLRMTMFADAGIDVTNNVNVGYVSRDAGHADDLTAFGSAIDLATSNNVVLTELTEVAFDHDICITTTAVPVAGDAGKEVRLLVEFVNKSG